MIIEKVINEYNDGLSVIEVADKLNLDRNKVKRILLKNGIKIRTRGETQLLNRNYRCFETIDSEEKSYWLGFIMADGCCIKNKLTIGLKGEDKSHLEKFKKFINSPNKISEGVVKLNNKIFTSCCFTVTCKILVQDLLKYGVGGKYNVHTDNGTGLNRHLSIIMNLNNDYKGGELIFTDQKNKEIKKIELVKGSIVFFPSNFMYPHGIQPIIEGTRYSIVAWLE